MVLNSQQLKFSKNYRNLNVKLSAKREYRDENVFPKGDRALSKLITLLRAGITYPIFTETYSTDLYFSVYCIYFFEPENFFCK